MKYLGLDLGTKTLGLAISDPLGIIATSYKILRHDEDYDSLLPMLKEEIEKNHIEALVLGFPKNMNNSVGERGEIALAFKEKLEEEFQLPVYMQDERLTTRQAESLLISNDTSRKKRKKVIDSLAATIILQSYLDRKEK
ncbi:Holliday junction resolvase RuvX [bacterium]|jgi:putative Holliday junction resolvase|nr:Holliday junction resolvase RuvX [bacterium]